jgi:hypothetical protein
VTIEEGEVRYGRKWNRWTPKEIQLFMAELKPTELTTPLVIQWTVPYFGHLAPSCKAYLKRLCPELYKNCE